MEKEKLNSKERRLILNSKPKLKKMWYVVLVLLAINIIFNVLFYIGTLYKTEGLLILLIILPAIILLSFIFWGTYRLHDWPGIFFWLWFIGAFNNMDIISIIIGALILFFYYYILRKINSSKQSPVNTIDIKKHKENKEAFWYIMFIGLSFAFLVNLFFVIIGVGDKYYKVLLGIAVGAIILSLYRLVSKDAERNKKSK